MTCHDVSLRLQIVGTDVQSTNQKIKNIEVSHIKIQLTDVSIDHNIQQTLSLIIQTLQFRIAILD